jgi:dTDP-4-amino-4,6-dideoxygalactose transaminase
MEMIPLYKPYMPENLPELEVILHSGALGYGKWGKQFESKLGTYIGNSKISVVNSFNSAMLVALATMGVGAGDELIASPMSCLASSQPLLANGAKVVWADVDPSSGTLNPDSVISKISSKTKAIFHNHYCGYLGHINEINEIGKNQGIFVVDDAIEGFGSEYMGNKLGNTGADITVFSFQTVRLPNTIDGGALVFKDQSLFEKSQLIRDLGIDRKVFRDITGEVSAGCDIILPGYGATMSEINSYIGCMQIEVIDSLLDLHRRNARCWVDSFCGSKSDIRTLDVLSGSLPNYWVFGVLSENKNETIKQFREDGVYASGVHFPNNKYSIFANNSHLPGVDEFYSKFLALPCGWWVQGGRFPSCIG